MLQEFNITLRFMIELCVLGIVGYWGFRVGTITAIKITLAIIFSIVVAVIWELFGAPHAE
ncbi:Adenine phosphoribosyltransferase [Bacillus cereus Rock4-18]|nr:Adenine phosphoribosyltransferase [Bacillus cereus Rock4-18]